MYELKYCYDDYFDDGSANWITIYRTKKELNNSEIIELCKEYILDRFLNYKTPECKESLEIVSAEEDDEERLEIHWRADKKDDGKYKYDNWEYFIFEFESAEEKEGWV